MGHLHHQERGPLMLGWFALFAIVAQVQEFLRRRRELRKRSPRSTPGAP